MLAPRQIEAQKLLLEGATPAQIDKVHVDFGMPMGPFQMSDLAGVDIGWHRDPNRIERSEAHTSELQSLLRRSYAVFCLKKQKPDHVRCKLLREQDIAPLPLHTPPTTSTP